MDRFLLVLLSIFGETESGMSESVSQGDGDFGKHGEAWGRSFCFLGVRWGGEGTGGASPAMGGVAVVTRGRGSCQPVPLIARGDSPGDRSVIGRSGA